MHLGNIPLFFDVLKSPLLHKYPISFPFDFYYDKNLLMYRQKGNDALTELLQKVYHEGSLLTGSMNESSGKDQADAAEEFINVCYNDIQGKRIVEIGCGNGCLLKRLETKGNSCVGIDPGSHIHEADETGIELIRDFFPSDKLTGKFDIILHFNVLEHIEDPVSFFNKQVDYLNENGAIIFGVPNCEPYLLTGDISMFVHEHYNYFTKQSILGLATECGLILESLVPGAANGMLFAKIKPSKGSTNKIDSQSFESFSPDDFQDKINKINIKIGDLISAYPQGELAIYCPIRSINALFLLGKTNCRFIDDDETMHQKYLPGFSKSIENLEDILNDPPKCIFIFSRTFTNTIKNKCLKFKELENTNIISIADLD